jgi:hypothetical protein
VANSDDQYAQDFLDFQVAKKIVFGLNETELTRRFDNLIAS